MENVNKDGMQTYTPEQVALMRLLDKGWREGMIRCDELQPRLEKLKLSSETIAKVYEQLEALEIRVIPPGAEPEYAPDQRQRLLELMEQHGEGLSQRQRDILLLRFAEGKTQAQTAEQLGVTRERVRQLEHKTLNTLLRRSRHPRKKIRDFYE